MQKKKQKTKKSNAKTVGQTSRKNAKKSPWTRPAERLSVAGRSQKKKKERKEKSHPGVEAVQFGQVSERQRVDALEVTRESGVGKEVTNRWDGEAESQWIVAARLLYHLQYLVPYLSRLQRIHLPDRLEL